MYKDKILCYLWVEKKTYDPYMLMVEGEHLKYPSLEECATAEMKTIQFDPEADLPKEIVKSIVNEGLELYRNGTIEAN
ncbi:MAG: DUF1801 domain-containing protein [Flavobacteriales bacterium]|nr:DUF1801 domain-containing protein [Flavobacteriales bacterium]